MRAGLRTSEVPLRISLSSALQRRAFRWKLPIRSRQPRLFLAFRCSTPEVESARLGGAPFDAGYTALGNPFIGTYASVMRLGKAPLESPVTALQSPPSGVGRQWFAPAQPVVVVRASRSVLRTGCISTLHPEWELPRYFGISTDTAENTRRLQNPVSDQIPA
jgi:hypothetical protein